MSDTSLTYDYVQTIVRDTINNSNGYISPLAFFTSVPAVQWVKGNGDKTSVINFVADKIHAEIISKTTNEIPLVGGTVSRFKWEHIVVANAIEHSIATEHQYATKQSEATAKIIASTEHMLRLIDANALSNGVMGLFGAQNVNNGNYVKVDKDYATADAMYGRILDQLDAFVGANSGGVINVLLGSAVTSYLRENVLGTKTFLEKILTEYVAAGLNINFVPNLLQYEAPQTLKKCGVPTAILANEVHLINPAKIKRYAGKDVEVISDRHLDLETIKISAGLTGMHAFDKDAIVKLSLTKI